MSALHYALNLPVITRIDDAKGDLLIESFAVKPREDDRNQLAEQGWSADGWRAIEDRYADEILEYQRGRKFLICSEMEVMRWRGELREKVLSTMTRVFTTCDYQENLLKTVGIESKRIPEPINEHLFYPGIKKPKQIVAIGSANSVENTRMLIDFYQALEGKDYHRVYIGVPLIWGYVNPHENQFRQNLELYDELKSVCDTFYEPSPMTRVARVLSESEFYANFAYREVSCRPAIKALMCGTGILWGRHPLGDELPVLCETSTVEEAVEALERNTGRVDVQALRDHALSHYSFASVKKRLEAYLRAN